MREENYQEKDILLNINTLAVHKLAEVNPIMQPEEITALRKSIECEGQKVPIIIFRNQIVDGRNRVNALKLLGITTVRADILSHNTSTEALKSIVYTRETRRMQTKTQLAILAYRESVKNSLSLTKASELRGVSRTDTRAARDLTSIKPRYVDALFLGNKIKLSTGTYSTSLQLILKDAKKQVEQEIRDVSSQGYLDYKDRSDAWKQQVKDAHNNLKKELSEEQLQYLSAGMNLGLWE